MNEETVIKVENVSKKYCKSLKRSMFYGVSDIVRNLLGESSCPDRLRENEFWAVDDVSFELKKGEALGLIGPNGSGKSTLLKLLNGIFWPDKGKITVKGRVGALIEVGAGFHPLLTGRENVYINGAILGMTRKEIDAKFDDIVEFADIGDFLDAPVKSYSSGMYVRLGFAVAVHCDPDILLVDEVLAVGDVNFKYRCFKHISEMMEKCAVVLVSHYPYQIRFMCQKTLFINHGKTQFLGPSSEGIDKYLDFMIRQNVPTKNSSKGESKYDSKVEMITSEVYDENLNRIDEVVAGETVIIKCAFNVNKPFSQAIVGFSFWLDGDERSFVCYSSQVDGGQYYDLTEGAHKVLITVPKVNLKAGMYNLSVFVMEKNEYSGHAYCDKSIIVKNPHPEFGLYSMQPKFDMDN